MACNNQNCECCNPNSRQDALGLAQTGANSTNVIGIPGPSIFAYEKEMGYIPEDMTYEEWRNQPVGSTNEIIEFGDNA